MERRLLKRRQLRDRRFPGVSVSYFEDTEDDGRLRYSSQIDISHDDRIVIDCKNRDELESKTRSTLQVALFCRRLSAP